jgi:hypothetical protein
MERILCAVWQELFGESSSPYTPEFKDFQQSWGSVDQRTTFKTLEISDRRLKRQQEIVVPFIMNCCLYPNLAMSQKMLCLVMTIGKVLSSC